MRPTRRTRKREEKPPKSRFPLAASAAKRRAAMQRFAAIILALFALIGAHQSAMAAALRPGKTASGNFSATSSLHAQPQAPQTLDLAGEDKPHDYETASGRPKWLSRDPIEEEGGVNLYGFVYNDPLNWIDDSGAAPAQPGGGAAPATPPPPKYPGVTPPAGYKPKPSNQPGVDPIEDATQFDPGQTNPGKANCACKACPDPIVWEAKNTKPGEHGSTGQTHFHSVTWTQIPLGKTGSKGEAECTCIPSRRGHPADPRKDPKSKVPGGATQIPGTY